MRSPAASPAQSQRPLQEEPDGAGRRPVLMLVAGFVVVLLLLAVGYRFGTGLDLGARGGTVTASDAEACAALGCDVHFTATLATKAYAERLGVWDEIEPRSRMAEAFVVSATSHAGSVRQLSLENKLFLRQDGILYPAVGRPLGISTHHNTYLVFFPRYDMQGQPLLDRQTGELELLVRDIDVPERTLSFRYPLFASNASRLALPQVFMVIGAAMAALLFGCTPCLVGSLMVGSLTTVTAARGSESLARLKSALVRQTVVYLAALIAMYLAAAVAVGLFKLQGDALRPVEVAGGLVLLAVGLGLLRGTTLAWRLRNGLSHLVASTLLRGSPKGSAGGRLSPSLGQGTASAMGASLAMVCSVAGAPTLSSAMLLPLLVYAGLSEPIWAFLILSAYLVVSAIPFFFVAVGLGEFMLTASARMQGALTTVSAVMLIGLGALLVVSPAAVAGLVSSPARLMLLPLRWLL